MLKQMSAIMIMCLACGPITLPPAAGAANWRQVDEVLTTELDGRGWVPGWEHKDEQSYMLELVPAGQTVENWKELLTIQTYPGLQQVSTPQEVMDKFLGNLATKYGATHNVLFKATDFVIFEWRVRKPSKLAQYELDKIKAGKQAIHFLHYANKNPNPPERDLWIKNFRRAQIVHRS